MTAIKKPGNNSRDSSLQDYATEISDVYQSYSFYAENNNNSVETLDSQKDQAPAKERMGVSFRHLPQVHISSRLSSLGVEDDANMIKSAPQSPHSGSSFDFNLRTGQVLTNSSLNVLLDTPTGESEFRHIIESTSELNLADQNDGGDVDRIVDNDHDWNEKGAAVRKVKDMDSNFRIIKRTVQDFKFGKTIGEGSYSTVVLATDKHTSKQYAVKVLDKRHIIKEKKVKYVNIEKHSLNRLSNGNGIISLYFTFQDKDSLYFVLDYASNGELLSLIKKYNTLNEDCVRLFGAQILDAIKYMHDNGVIHRDIKPENILLDDNLRIKITDFGTARLLERKDDESQEYPLDVRAKSFVGTAEYVSPELLDNKYCGKPGDIWAFGCILYQMIAGKPPFKASNEYLTFQKITKLQYAFSAGFPNILRDLIKQILVLQPSKRATIKQIQEHFFFQSVDFDDPDQIWNCEIPELGPYKMNAKAMMKLPELGKSSSSANLISKKRAKKVNSVNDENSKKLNNESAKLVNPASVAAYVLNREGGSNDDENKTDIGDVPKETSKYYTATNGSQKASTPDYIPGTNILRPSINNLSAYKRPSTSQRNKPTKPKSRILQVTPFGALETAWVEFLEHPDERILKLGEVTCQKIPTDFLEKKYKLQDWSYPKNGSLLSQVVNASGSMINGSSEEIDNLADESDAFIEYYETIEEPQHTPPPPPRSETSESNTSSKSHKSIFQKLLRTHGDKTKENQISDSESITKTNVHQVKGRLLDKSRICTIIVTTHGRVLILFRNNEESSYRLINEIKLNHGFIQIKEVTQPTNKFQKLFPASAIFAITSYSTSFIFEVDKYQLHPWTEALVRAKVNQYERVKAALEKPKRSISESNSNKSSPKLTNSPVFNSTPTERFEQKRISSSQQADPTSTTPSSRVNPENKHRGLMASRSRKSTSKRKPPPVPLPLKSSNESGVSGLGVGGSGEGILHAAQLAVSNNVSIASASPKPARSSFTKSDGNKVSQAPRYNQSSSHTAPTITSLNSKFLARSQRNK